MRNNISAIPLRDRLGRPGIVGGVGGGARGDWLMLAVIWSYLLATLVFEVTGLVVAVQIGSFDLNLFDVPFFFSVALGGYALLVRPKYMTIALALAAAVGVLLVVNLVRGMMTDVTASLIWLRANGFIVIAIALGMTARIDARTEREVVRAFTLVSLVLALLIVLRFAFGPGVFALNSDMAAENEFRPISVHGAMMMDVAAVLLLSGAMRGRWRMPRTRIVALAIIVVCIALTAQGTVTLCLIAGVALLLMLENGPRIAARVIGLGAAAILGTIVALIPTELFMSQDVQQRLADRGRNREFREFIWRGFTDYLGGQSNWTLALGHPADRRPSFMIYPPGAEQMWAQALHSMYYGQIATTGYIGLAIYVVMLAVMAVTFGYAIARRRQPMIFSAAAGLALIVQAVLLGYSYELRNEEVLLLLLAWIIGRAFPSFSSRRLGRRTPLARVSVGVPFAAAGDA